MYTTTTITCTCILIVLDLNVETIGNSTSCNSFDDSSDSKFFKFHKFISLLPNDGINVELNNVGNGKNNDSKILCILSNISIILFERRNELDSIVQNWLTVRIHDTHMIYRKTMNLFIFCNL
ncbi:hypothetical protein KSF78_0008389 [Schistosoma japonicum]|nr:hypothetical protein KSF78_0008389 [Schistosoma japonicum]